MAIYCDPTSGHAPSGTAHVNLLVSIPTDNVTALPVFLAYDSTLIAPGLFDQSSPDTSWFQGSFSWDLTFHVST